jgi:transporter family protein
VALLGGLGVTVRFALRGMSWQSLVVLTACAYVTVAIVLLATGTPLRIPGGKPGWTAVVSAYLPPLAVMALYLALDRGTASKVTPLTTAYPFITVFLAALFLSEAITLQVLLGCGLIVAGAIVISV